MLGNRRGCCDVLIPELPVDGSFVDSAAGSLKFRECREGNGTNIKLRELDKEPKKFWLLRVQLGEEVARPGKKFINKKLQTLKMRIFLHNFQ